MNPLSDLTERNFWFMGKRLFQDTIGMNGTEAHVHIGMLIFVLCALYLRRRRHGLLISWLVVVIFQTANELMDARDWINWTGTVNWVETARDYAATLLWPTVVALLWGKLGVKPEPQQDKTPIKKSAS